MPMYEYECGTCGRRFEQLQRIMDDALTTDPECGGPVRRVIQPVGIIFKGSGFYVTDSRKTGSASTSTNGSSESGATEAKSEKKSDTTAESKSDGKGSGKPEVASSAASSSTSSGSSGSAATSKPAPASAG